VTSLRLHVIVGAALWTVGLMAVWAVMLTFHRESFQALAVVHHYPHTLMVVAIAAMITGMAIVTRGIAPLHELRRRLGTVRAGAADRVDGRYPTEVQPLVAELNALLAHQAQAVGRAQAKAGDLAHGLKTPLAILAHEAERARALGHGELAAGIDEQVERMRRQIEYHLAHARAAASAAAGVARASVADSAEGLARTLRRLHGDRGVTIEVRVDPGVTVRCERADLDEMLGNLLDNACKWARSRVVISVDEHGADGGRHAIVVEDDGPGIEAALRDKVLQRGVRADEAAPGSGFGLAIVRELAELYGGGVSLDTAPLGGVAARLTLARNSATPQLPTPN
jgi:signal transduction histidine kinase